MPNESIIHRTPSLFVTVETAMDAHGTSIWKRACNFHWAELKLLPLRTENPVYWTQTESARFGAHDNLFS